HRGNGQPVPRAGSRAMVRPIANGASAQIVVVGGIDNLLGPGPKEILGFDLLPDFSLSDARVLGVLANPHVGGDAVLDLAGNKLYVLGGVHSSVELGFG